MANSTIANLPSGSPAQPSDQLPIQRGSSTLKILVSDILALVTAGLPNNASSIVTETAPYSPTLSDGTILCNGNVASTITNVVESAGSVVTLSATNTLVAGQTVYLSGLTTAIWLNGLVVTVLSAGLSGSQFEFNDPTAHGTQATHAETGTATLLVVITLATNLTSGTTFRIKNIGATLVTVSSAVNIDGATSYQLNPYQYASIDVQWDGTQWWLL